MPFGKYKGTAMANVPASYLNWARRTWTLTTQTAAIMGYIQDNRDVIAKELEKELKAKES